MTDLLDLIQNPKERLTVCLDRFLERLEAQHKKDEEALDRVFEHHRVKLHRRHLKIVSSYKHILDELYVKLDSNPDAYLVEMMERILRAPDKAPYAEVFRQALPVIDKVERDGGSLDMSIKHYDGSKISSGGCLFSERGDGHFRFLDEFLDGFDDHMDYKVVRMNTTEKQKKEEEERRWQTHLQEWRAKQTPSNEVILAEMGIEKKDAEEKKEPEYPSPPSVADLPELMARF
jgi:hypothetical protein